MRCAARTNLAARSHLNPRFAPAHCLSPPTSLGAAHQIFFDLTIDNSGAGLDNPANGRAGLHLIPGVEASDMYGTAKHEARFTMSEEWNVLYHAWNARFIFGDQFKDACAVATPLERTAWHTSRRVPEADSTAARGAGTRLRRTSSSCRQ